jgi:hypothetical protein
LSRIWKFNAKPTPGLWLGVAREIHRVMRRQDTVAVEPLGKVGDQTVGVARELRSTLKLLEKKLHSFENVSEFMMLTLDRVSRMKSKRAYHKGLEECGREGRISQGMQKILVPLSSKVEPKTGSSISG